MGQKKNMCHEFKGNQLGHGKVVPTHFLTHSRHHLKIARKIAFYYSKNFYLTFFFLKKNQRFKQTVVLISRL